MKKHIIILACLLSTLFLMAMTVANVIRPLNVPLVLEPKPIVLIAPQFSITPIKKIVVMDQVAFLHSIGQRESSGNYKIVNSYGYLGKYQFGQKTLKWIGIKTTPKAFLKDTLLQEQAMIALMRKNKKSLNRHIKKYDGKIVNGVLITESGLIAAAHLGGAGSVRKFLRNGREFKDAYGTSIVDYIQTFNGYKLEY